MGSVLDLLLLARRARVGGDIRRNGKYISCSIFMAVFTPHADICDLWAAGLRPRPPNVFMCGRIH